MVFDAIVLAGERSARLGGKDKALVAVEGRTLLERAVEVAAEAGRVVVVGPRRELLAPVVWAQEDPPGGGPVAALVAAIGLIHAELVLALAVDYPLVTAADIRLLVASAGREGATAVDRDGRMQPLLAVYPRPALASALTAIGDPRNARVGDVISALSPALLPLGDAAMDCDTWEDIEAAQAALTAGGDRVR